MRNVAETESDVVNWLVVNDAHDFSLEYLEDVLGVMIWTDEHEIFVPDALTRCGLFESSEEADTGAIFRPTVAGLAHLSPSVSKDGRQFLGFQLADSKGKNIQGNHSDPTGLTSLEVMPRGLALEVIADYPGFKLQAIFESDLEYHIMLPESVRTTTEVADPSP